MFFSLSSKWRYIRFSVRYPAVLRIRDPVPFWPLDPGSRIVFLRISDLGSRIPDIWSRISDPGSKNPYFWKPSYSFLGKKFYISLKICQIFFLQHFKNKIIFNFLKFMATKKGMTTNFFHSSLLFLFLDPKSGMGKNQDLGSGITIPDPQHFYEIFSLSRLLAKISLFEPDKQMSCDRFGCIISQYLHFSVLPAAQRQWVPNFLHCSICQLPMPFFRVSSLLPLVPSGQEDPSMSFGSYHLRPLPEKA
jgi:hypothetical protein